MTREVEYYTILISHVECRYPFFQCSAVLAQWLKPETGKVPAELVAVILMRESDRPIDMGFLSGQLL